MNKVIYFSSPGCGVCMHLKPKVQALIESKFPKLAFKVVDISKEPEMAGKHTVFTAPTVLVFFDNKETHRFVRNMSVNDIEVKIARLYSLYFE